MRYAHIIRTLAAAAICAVAAQTASPASYLPVTEDMRRTKLALQNSDRSELPFLEETTIKEDARETDRWNAAEAYLKLATLDESVAFMRRHFTERRSEIGGTTTMIKFLKKASTEEKDAEEGTRENLYVFLLEVAQSCMDSGDAYKADVFLLERVPGYAESKQRAALVRYANTGNEWVTNTFNPIKAHFDAIPPSKRIDLRNRFPDLPPLPEDPPKPSSPYLWPAIAAAILAIIALAIRKVRKGKK